MPIVTRFAPSPTGLLHLGSARAAVLAHDAARAAGGRFLLRIEDIDASRCRPEYTAAILEDLAWLGLAWDGPVRVQSRYVPEYAATLDALRGRGLLYPCFCTRAEIAREAAASAAAPHAPTGETLYPGTCRHLDRHRRAARLAAGEAHCWRLDMAAALAAHPAPLTRVEQGRRVACHPSAFGDVVLGRRDTPASYHLCATQDDAVQGVTLVTRGADLREVSDLHRLLQALMGWPEPAYAHHALLTDGAGRRFSKRDGARTLRALRAAGVAPEAVRRCEVAG